MKTITVLEDRKNRVKSANSLLPSLLTDEELNQISGGAPPFQCTTVTCGPTYSITMCFAKLYCSEKYVNGGTTCEGKFSVVADCPRYK